MLLRLIFILFFPFIISAQVTTGLVAHYPLDNANANDMAGTRHGFLNGVTSVAGRNGIPNTAFLFDGFGNNIHFGNNDPVNINGSVTLCVSYRPFPPVVPADTQFISGLNNKYIFSTGGHTTTTGYTLVWSKGTIAAARRTTTHLMFTGFVPYVDNNWQYTCIVYDSVSNNMKTYNNCILEAFNPGVVSPSTNIFKDVYAGRANSAGGFYFDGLIEDIKIYNRALTEPELDTLYYLMDSICPKYDTITASACGSYVSPSGNHTWTTSGIYKDTVPVEGQRCGCDTIFTVNLTVNPQYTGPRDTSICQGDSILLGGVFRKTAGVYADTLSSQSLCDSVLNTTLTVHPFYHFSQNQSVCQGDSLLIFGTYRKLPGIYNDNYQTAKGCDSSHSVTLTVNPKFFNSLQLSICQGDSALIFGAYRTIPGTYNVHYLTAKGCDSISEVTLGVNVSPTVNKQLKICNGDSAFLAGEYRHTSGVYRDSLATVKGCDSIISTTLTVNTKYSFKQDYTICEGDSVEVFGIYRFASGTYFDSLQTRQGCDSVYEVNIDYIAVDTLIAVVRDTTLIAINSSASYRWLRCDSNYAAMPGAVFQSFTPSGTGWYAVEVSSGGCTDTSSCRFIDRSVGIGEFTALNEVYIYPNPVHDRLVNVHLGDLKNVTIVATDVTGQLISRQVNVTGPVAQVELNKEPGIYLLEILAAEERKYFRVIKN